MNKKILLIGGGGHCHSVLDSLLNSNEYSVVGIIDNKNNIDKQIMGVSIIGTDEDLLSLYNSGFHYAFITIGSIGDSSLRVGLFNMLKEIGFNIPNIIDESAIVSPYVKLEDGIFIGKGAVINSNSIVNSGAIINTGSIIEHDNTIEEFSHIAPGVVLCGNVTVRKGSHVGAGSVVKQRVIVGENTTIGMNSNVLTDIKSNTVAYGNPCKEVGIK